jgi:hypothetical protein
MSNIHTFQPSFAGGPSVPIFTPRAMAVSLEDQGMTEYVLPHRERISVVIHGDCMHITQDNDQSENGHDFVLVPLDDVPKLIDAMMRMHAECITDKRRGEAD